MDTHNSTQPESANWHRLTPPEALARLTTSENDGLSEQDAQNRLAVYAPALDRFFEVEPLSLAELLVCLGLGSLSFAAIELEKWVVRRQA